MNQLGIKILVYPQFAWLIKDASHGKAEPIAKVQGLTIGCIHNSSNRKESVISQNIKMCGDHPGIDILQHFIGEGCEIIVQNTGPLSGAFHGVRYNSQLFGNDKTTGGEFCTFALYIYLKVNESAEYHLSFTSRKSTNALHIYTKVNEGFAISIGTKQRM